MSDKIAIHRLEDQIDWYHRRSISNQRVYKLLKIVVIILAPLIPFVSQLVSEPLALRITSAIGIIITVTEGLQHLNQYHANWIAYRSTCETLKHEKFLYLAKAGHYAATRDANMLLAERIESLVSQEHAKWASAQEESKKAAEQPSAKPSEQSLQ